MAKLAIFDIDGTLLDSNDAHALSWLAAFESQGITVPYDRIRQGIGMGGDHFLKETAHIEEKSPIGEAVGKEKDRVFKKDFADALRAFPRAGDLVRELQKRGFQIAVATSAEHGDMKMSLDRIGISDSVTIHACADNVSKTKPDPDLLHSAVDKAGVHPRDAIFIGDTPYDIEAGRRAGVKTIGICAGGCTAEELLGATEVYSDPAELLELLDGSILRKADTV